MSDGLAVAAIESALAQRHLFESTLVLYDVTSTYFEGHSCPPAKFGHSRDERRNNPQITFGCSRTGRVVRWPWRCSQATPVIRKRWPRN
jgi:hypothetical protein